MEILIMTFSSLASVVCAIGTAGIPDFPLIRDTTSQRVMHNLFMGTALIGELG
jgi:hypothetical protein